MRVHLIYEPNIFVYTSVYKKNIVNHFVYISIYKMIKYFCIHLPIQTQKMVKIWHKCSILHSINELNSVCIDRSIQTEAVLTKNWQIPHLDFLGFGWNDFCSIGWICYPKKLFESWILAQLFETSLWKADGCIFGFGRYVFWTYCKKSNVLWSLYWWLDLNCEVRCLEDLIMNSY